MDDIPRKRSVRNEGFVSDVDNYYSYEHISTPYTTASKYPRVSIAGTSYKEEAKQPPNAIEPKEQGSKDDVTRVSRQAHFSKNI